ncbi:hypothetical protein VOLCADRAFT_91464 [Volvox carteri f. nagariensis]|uniref:Glycosyl transferase CAP10 domain-containing protein n=1 Tax=Volvox carteri f. nagariensis TaxID=3068 RepID=D8TX53_VOLCA|nr:uncharacterized protein VOLCADRAFT_91464 [Volvox carteri f. nagariensis]EFJ47847.1 hypothetical protein VOLCADRAFT_91464 [Volvox carteri f. nagariensis]|eukprot:XP_002950953.1 hypothetical protein VOLCADRAFT_91464 [Volvox carteri f. nagariensis]
MEAARAKPFLLLLVILYQLQHISGSWKRSKLTQCELHPDLELRIQRDVGFWGDKGISEDATLSVCKFCDPDHLGPYFEFIGFLVELYEASQTVPVSRGKVWALIISASASLFAPRYLSARLSVCMPVCHDKCLASLLAEWLYCFPWWLAVDGLDRLPDVEFTYWFGDNAPAYTQINPDGTTKWSYSSTGETPPIFAWSKWNENAALVVPYSGAYRCPSDSWDAIESQLEPLASVSWSARNEVAFGRWNTFCTHYIPWMKTADGEVMKCPRSHLVSLAEAHPDLLDTYDLGRARPVPLAHQNVYKYIVSTDGWSISSKFDKYLLLGSAVFKVAADFQVVRLNLLCAMISFVRQAASTRFGFYYDAIKPYEHYLPYMVNSSNDILDVISWAKSNDEQVRRIAEAGRRFALQNLNRAARLCYLFRLLTELSKKMRYTPSCERRQLCVPLVREIRFFQSYRRTAQSCKYTEVLLRYGDEDPADLDPESNTDARAAGVRSYYGLEELQRLHENGNAWPRDDLLLQVRQQYSST